MRHAMRNGLAAAALVLLAVPGLLVAQQHGHGEHERPMRGMTGHAMGACPMAAGMMEAVLHHAEHLELTEEQVAHFEELRERYEDGDLAMREVMEVVHETLSPDQLQMLRETFHGHMGGMMHGGMMGPMMHGEGHRMHGPMHEGRMGARSEECPMMMMMRSGPGEGHPHSR